MKSERKGFCAHVLFYDYEFAESLGFVAPLILIYDDNGAKEVTIVMSI